MAGFLILQISSLVLSRKFHINPFYSPQVHFKPSMEAKDLS